MSILLTADGLVSMLTLTALEIVLGVDNLVFISIISGRLPAAQQPAARKIGLLLALGTRVALLFTLSWMMGLTRPLFSVFGGEVSGRGLILLAGGLFLIAKATWEIYDKVELGETEHAAAGGRRGFVSVVLQIMVLDIVFSLDSVITAVGMARELWVMVTAMVIAVGVMLVFAGPVSDFVHRHPTVRMLALSFLILIGVMLVAEGVGQHIDRGYVYFAMGFSLFVELLNLRMRPEARHVELHDPRPPSPVPASPASR
jgi:predicted tellurium resistance membrane protein TerC